jgi:radical SAM protein with 4Fe4S-binding SPASM domain
VEVGFVTDEPADAVVFLRRSLDNPLARRVLGYLSEGGRLETALEALVTGTPPTLSCRLNSLLLHTLLNLGARAFNVNFEEYLEFFQDKYVRRGVTTVLKSLGEYGVTEPQKLTAPFLVVWNYTKMCNLRCIHCYSNAGVPAPDELSFKEKIRAVDELAEAGVVSIAFSGGEPLLGKDFYEVAEYASEQGFYVSVATNGTLVTKNVARKLADFVDYVEVSLDHSQPELHDRFRGKRGAFKKTLKGIRNCAETDMLTCVATTVTRSNLGCIPDLIDIAEDLGADRFIAFNFIPIGRGKETVDLDISPDQKEELLKYLYRANGTKAIQVFSTAPQFARVAFEETEKKEKGDIVVTHFATYSLSKRAAAIANFIGGCGAGRLYCSLEHNGDIQPCVFMPIRVGNIREGFERIWKESPVLKTLRDRTLLKGHCSQCQYNLVCGGCRARAYRYMGDVTAPDPGCINNSKEWESLQKLERKVEVLAGQGE